MKKVLFSGLLLMCVVMIITAADFRNIPGLLEAKRKNSCKGYTIIEFDKAVDCNGDTIALVRTNGYAEPVMNQ